MPDRRYPRTARLGRLIQQIVADELERVALTEDRLELVTVTHVSVEPDLRHATVLLSSMDDATRDALEEVRIRLQGAVARQARLKRTPQLSFAVDPGVSSGERVESILRELGRHGGNDQQQP
jgi:ribosome-binding factor A